jgi:hypothetical protein
MTLAPLSEPWSVFVATNLLAATSQRRYAIKRSKIIRKADDLAESRNPLSARATTNLARAGHSPVMTKAAPLTSGAPLTMCSTVEERRFQRRVKSQTKNWLQPQWSHSASSS